MMLGLQLRGTTMDRAKLYQDRLAELNWSEYRLAQEIAARRQQSGIECTTQSIYSSIRKALKDPGNTRQSTNDEIVEVLGGQTLIRWTRYEDVVV